MKAINRLYELQKMDKYSSYLDKELIPAVNKELNLKFIKRLVTDPYTISYSTIRNEDNELLDTRLIFTTNRKELEGKFWGTLRVAGISTPIGNIVGKLDEDVAIIVDAYYYFYETEVNPDLLPSSIKLD